jgi:hypothetical protein
VVGDRHLYLTPEDLAEGATAAGVGADHSAADQRLRRILADVPIRVGRSGLTLLLIGTTGTANIVAQALDESSLDEPEGTVAGDNTVLVLFADEERLGRWLERFVTFGDRIELGSRVRPGPTRLDPSARPRTRFMEARR